MSREQTNYAVFVEAVRIFKKYLRADSKVFKCFKQSLPAIKAMDIEAQLKQSKESDQKVHQQYKKMIFDEDYLLVLKFCAYILRHHGLYIPIDQMTTNTEIQADILRAERFVMYEDLDDLYNGLETEVINFNEYRQVTTNGFKEVLQLHESHKQEFKTQIKRESQQLGIQLQNDISQIQQRLATFERSKMVNVPAPVPES